MLSHHNASCWIGSTHLRMAQLLYNDSSDWVDLETQRMGAGGADGPDGPAKVVLVYLSARFGAQSWSMRRMIHDEMMVLNYATHGSFECWMRVDCRQVKQLCRKIIRKSAVLYYDSIEFAPAAPVCFEGRARAHTVCCPRRLVPCVKGV